MNFSKAPQQYNSVRRWVCRTVHELIVQNRDPIEYAKAEVVMFT